MVLDRLLLSLIAILIGVTLFLGLFVLLTKQGWEKLNTRNFFYLTFAIVVWQTSSLLSLIVKTYDYSLFWERFSFAAGAVVAYFLIKFVIYFPQQFSKNLIYIRLVNYFGLIVSIFAAFISLNHNFISDIIFTDNVLIVNYGSYYQLFLIPIIILLIILIILMFFNYKNSDKTSRQKIRSFFTGLIISAIIVFFTDVVSPLVFGHSMDYLSNFSFISSIILVGFTTYAIVKNELFDIRMILTETSVILVIFALIVQLILSQTTTDYVVNFIILILVVYGGYLIIKSVQNEIRQKEELQVLSKQLEQANAHLKDLDAMKTEFVSLASHELLTPVSAIEGYLSMILDEHLAKVDDPKAAQYLDRIYRSSRRLARLIADMLNISRIEEGRLLVEKKDVNLNELVSQTIDELKFKAEERKQKIVFEMSNEAQNPNDKKDIANKLRDASPVAQHDNYMTYADPDKIKEVIVNIIGNSIKYSKNPGTISISIEKASTEKVKEIWGKIEDQVKDQPLDDQESIKASVDEHYRQFVGDEQLLIIVKDQGIGIPKDELTKLFKKFHRIGDYSTEESQGTGLGLYISRSLVELHHGRIWADSDGPGKGSTFTFSLPDISDKEELLEVEKQMPEQKEQLKPLAKPMNNKIGEDI